MIGDMYGDFSRLTFAPEKHFSAVLVQQGRLVLDADANEGTAILLHNLRRFIADVVGPYGAPGGGTGNFQIALDTSTPGRPTLGIGGGRYYVNGLLCEADASTTYYEQPDTHLDSAAAGDRLPDGDPYVVYLVVWERHITAAEDPSIRERALGDNGPDTAARSKVVWQVRASADLPPGSGTKVSSWPAVDRANAVKAWQEWEAQRTGATMPQLRARAQSDMSSVLEPCLASPTASYRGLENQLYRIEVHTGGTADAGGTATFKWSRENGAAVFPVESLSGSDATVATLGRDVGLGLAVNDWVELLDDRSVMRGERHPLARVSAVEPLDRIVTLERAPAAGVGADPALHPILRRWDQQEGPAEAGFPRLDPATGVLAIEEGKDGDGWLAIEDGVQVQFQPGGRYSAGDYWLIPARTATEDVEWPQVDDAPAARPPAGVEYAYAPLAVVDAGGGVIDLRSVFSPLAQPVT
jgi:hypothetical protein